MLTSAQDAYGHLIFAHHQGYPVTEIVERDDGWIGTSEGAEAYFAPHAQWPPHQRRAIRAARGRVLDVGCGAGRVSLFLQERGHEVVGIDVSPLAVRTCRLRGVSDARVLRVTQTGPTLGRFDTIVMLGNNFGLMENPVRAAWLLRRFHRMTAENGRIIAESNNPYATDSAVHRSYHRRNRRRGRMPGQIRIRVRYSVYCTPWFDYLIVSPPEMKRLLRGTGWRITRIFESDGSSYAVELRKR